VLRAVEDVVTVYVARVEPRVVRRRELSTALIPTPYVEQTRCAYVNIIIIIIITLAYRCQHNMAPYYLAVQLNRASSVVFRQRLRSAQRLNLSVPRTVHSTIGDRAFCMTAARAWNTLTPSVQSSESLTGFRRRLKTELFSRSFPD